MLLVPELRETQFCFRSEPTAVGMNTSLVPTPTYERLARPIANSNSTSADFRPSPNGPTLVRPHGGNGVAVARGAGAAGVVRSHCDEQRHGDDSKCERWQGRLERHVGVQALGARKCFF
jgi:hypothetical protein